MPVLTEMTHDPDAPLVESFRQGDERAFAELVRRHKDRVYNVVYRYLGDHEDASDIAQEVFIRAYRGINSFQSRSRFYTWLHTIAANLSRNRLRDQRRKGRSRGTSLHLLQDTAPGALAHAASHDTGAARLQHQELNEALQICLDDLPEQFRFAFVLRVMDELNYDDIAAAVGCPKGTVKSRLNHARKRLGECLKSRGAL